MPTVSYQLRMLSIDITSKMMRYPTVNPSELLDFDFNYVLDIRLLPETKIAMSVTDLSIMPKGSPDSLAHIQAICTFEVNDFDEVFRLSESNERIVPPGLELTLKSTGLSTTRGILYSELKGTYLHKAIFPLVDVATAIKEDRDRVRSESTGD